MGFIGNVFAWVIAAAVGYFFASAFSTFFVQSDLAALGVPIDLGTRLSSTWSDLLSTWQYYTVILLGYAIAFFVASLIKALLPVLSRIAYLVAGAAAVWAALTLMDMQFGSVPIGGARSDLGFLFQVLAGAMGGLAFELLRPKEE